MILATVDGSALRPFLALLLLTVGLRILVRFSRPLPVASAAATTDRPLDGVDLRGVQIAGATGGLTNGLVGTWGPVVTPFLLHRGVPPRFAIGSVNTAEVAVAVVSVGAFLSTGGAEGLAAGVVIAMLLGGVAAAPLAAYVVRFLPPRLLGLAVAGLLLVTQTRELLTAGWLPQAHGAIYGTIAVGLLVAGVRPHLPTRQLATQELATQELAKQQVATQEVATSDGTTIDGADGNASAPGSTRLPGVGLGDE